MTKYIENNIIFPSVKIYKDVMNIDDTLNISAPACSNLLLFNCSEQRESLSKFNKALDKVECAINHIKKSSNHKNNTSFFL